MNLPKKALIFIFTFFSGIFFYFFSFAQSCTDHNVWGWAWSGNIGWISFSCKNTNASVNYGVDIQPDGTLTGYAWSENIGWIQFNPSGPYPTLPNFSARLDLDGTACGQAGRICGWARAVRAINPEGQDLGGWDGWIKLSGTIYGVWIDTSTSPHELRDYAWGGDVIGWISFNCKEGGSNKNDICSTKSNYKVVTSFSLNQPPYVSNLITSTPNYCTELSGIGQINLSWRYNDNDGDPQSQYQIQVQSSGGTMYVDCTIDATVATGTQESVAIRISQSPTSQLCDYPNYIGDVPYNTSLQWRVRVKDNKGAWSDWSSWVSFSTAHHPYPYVDFTWTPSRPVVGEAVQFTSLSQVFYGSPSYLWTFTNATPSSATTQNATTTFTSGGDQNATLRVTDSMGYYCEKTKAINVRRQPFYFPIPPVPPQ